MEKHVAILKIYQKSFEVEPIRLRSVRPFVIKEISLSKDSKIKNPSDRTAVTQFLIHKVEEAIKEANVQWLERQEGNADSDQEVPLPLVRLRVDYAGPQSGGLNYVTENPQRFSNRFVGKVANTNDVVQFYVRKKPQRRLNISADAPNEEQLDGMKDFSKIKVKDFVHEFLSVQTLDVLPEEKLADAIAAFVDKDDKLAVKNFVDSSLDSHFKGLLLTDAMTEDQIREAMRESKSDQVKMSAPAARTAAKANGNANANGNNTRTAPGYDSDFDVQEEPRAGDAGRSSDEEGRAASRRAARAAPAKGNGRAPAKSRARRKPVSDQEDSIEEEAPPA